MKFKSFDRLTVAGVLGTAVLFMSSLAQGSSLGLVLFDSPDIFSSFIDVTYDAANDQLVASGFAFNMKDEAGVLHTIQGGSFNLTANIDDAGNLIGGSLLIEGTIASLGFNSGTLISADLDQIGFLETGGDPLEFLMTVTGGDVAALYPRATGGIIMASTGFTGGFAADFDNLIAGIAGTGNGVADVAAIPVPAALWLLGTGLLALAGYGRRKS